MGLNDDVLHLFLLTCEIFQRHGAVQLRHHRDGFLDLKTEYMLDIEVTPVKIDGEKDYYIRLGSFNHPACTSDRNSVTQILNNVVKMKIKREPPLLHLSSLCLALAVQVGTLISTDDLERIERMSTAPVHTPTSVGDDNDDDGDGDDDDDVNKEQQVSIDDGTIGTAADAAVYPWLAKFGVMIDNEMGINGLLQDLLRLDKAKRNREGGEGDKGVGVGTKSCFAFWHVNNKPGLLLSIPRASSQIYFNRHLKNGNFLLDMLDFIVSGSESTPGNAAEWIMSFLGNEFEDEFVSVATEKGIAITPKVMDAQYAAAMWTNANASTATQRSILRDLSGFFGHRFVVPEHAIRKLNENSFPPKCGHFLDDENKKIDYWYKPVDELLEHQAKFILSDADIVGIKHVDLAIGGDHGKGRFCMILKVLIRYHEVDKESKTFLYQVGEIDCVKDNLDILKKSIATPLGDSMQRIIDGGSFVLSRCEGGLTSLSFSEVSGADCDLLKVEQDVPINIPSGYDQTKEDICMMQQLLELT